MITEKEIDEELERFCNDKEFIGIEDSQKTIKISLHKKVWKDVIMQLLERKINTFEISDSITMFLKLINENFILNRTTDIVYE